MALNKFMHPRNVYKKPPDFKQLAVEFPEFRKHVIQEVSGKVTIDFKNAESLRALSTALLKKDVGLDIYLPLDRLIPTIPLRINYILWLEDVLHDSRQQSDNSIKGIDIGTGASCVYPLLGCKMNNWQFLATDVDQENLLYARRNVEKNGLSEMIAVEKVPPNSILADVLTGTLQTYDFCMCNPPFFADHLEAQGLTSRSDDRPEPHSSSTASCVEQIAEGGEVAFVKRMIHESLNFKDKIRIFTSMLGKKSSLVPLKNELRLLKVPQFSSTEFCQGKTMRWGIGWSFDTTVTFPKSVFQVKKKDKPPLQYEIPEHGDWDNYDVQSISTVITGHLDKLKIIYETLKSTSQFVSLSLCAKKNTWSNMRRKRRELKKQKMVPEVESRETTIVPSGGDNPVQGDNRHQNSVQVTTESVACENEKIVHSSAEGKRKFESDHSVTENINKKQCVENSTARTSVCTDSGVADCIGRDKSVESTAADNVKESKQIQKNDPCTKPLPNGDVIDNVSGEYLFKCNLKLREPEAGHIIVEMSWIDGQNRESMHQVLQYIKNQLQCSSSQQRGTST